MKQKITLFILAVLLSFTAHSGPARKGQVYLTQPDGNSFSARIRGDEFMKIVTTGSGCSIIQDADGWWCYASYDENGVKSSSSHRVGHDTPEEIISLSRNIPYGKLAANAQRKRMEAPWDEEPIMKRVLKRHGIAAKGTETSAVTKHGIIILAQFKDQSFTHTREDFVNLLTQSGYRRNSATGSAKEYFDSQFHGKFEFSFDVSSIVTLPENMAYYGANNKDDSDMAPEEMIIDACELVDNEIDFSIYDDDGDGEVDNVFVFFAGGDEAEGAGSDRIWSHSWYIYSGAGKELVLDGKKIDRYACTSELSRRYSSPTDFRDVLAGIGTFCHEYFHTFGIPDMYDSDYEGSGGTAAGLWMATSLMDAGNQNNYGNTPPNLNAIERELLGISEPVVIESNGGYELEPIHKSGRYYRLDTDNKDEYYLIECRSDEGWDAYIGGRGMLVYHIDKSERDAGSSDGYGRNTTAFQRWQHYNEVNCRPDHQCADLVEADARKDGFSIMESESFYASADNIRSIFFPNSATNSLHPDSALKYWSGAQGKTSITNIRETSEGIAFNALGFEESDLPPAVASYRTEAFMDAAIIQFESDRPFEGEAAIEWGRTGLETESISIKPYQPGKYAITLENLQPDNKTYTVKINFVLDGLAGDIRSISFMTKKSPAVKWPFIFISGDAKNSDGTFAPGSRIPLRLYNAKEAAEISWTLDGKEIRVGGDGYFTVEDGGILKAHIIRKDGSEEIIMKEIIIKEVLK